MNQENTEMKLPTGATDKDYIRCEKIVRRILGNEENVNVQELTLKIMGICYAKGGGYSGDIFMAFADTYINKILKK